MSGGCIITQAELCNSVLCQRVRVEKGARVRESVLFQGVKIGEGAMIKKAIIDKNVAVPPSTQIGYSREEDEARGFKVSDGITVVPKNYLFA